MNNDRHGGEESTLKTFPRTFSRWKSATTEPEGKIWARFVARLQPYGYQVFQLTVDESLGIERNRDSVAGTRLELYYGAIETRVLEGPSRLGSPFLATKLEDSRTDEYDPDEASIPSREYFYPGISTKYKSEIFTRAKTYSSIIYVAIRHRGNDVNAERHEDGVSLTVYFS